MHNWPSGGRATAITVSDCAVCAGGFPTLWQREMLRLQYEQELSVTDISRQLGVNKSTVSRCLRRARQRLYDRLRFTL